MPVLNHSGNVLDEVSDAIDHGGSGLRSSVSSLTPIPYRLVSQRPQRQALGRRIRVRRNKGQKLVQTV